MMTLMTRSISSTNKVNNTGFTLVEIAVVLVVLGLILGSILGPLGRQQENQKIKSTEKQLLEIHDALLGFAALNGYLPCPATLTSDGLEDRVADGSNDCSEEHGFVPSASLGINGKFDEDNLVTDSWGTAIYYSLNDVGSWEYAKNITLNAAATTYDICLAAGCGAGNVVADNVVAVLISLGPDRDESPGSADQQDNLDDDDEYVHREVNESVGSEYNDILLWLSPNTLTLHMVKSGQLGGG